MPTLGSMVQNGKFCASALALERELKRVLLPTLGRPTMPQEKPMMRSGFALSRSAKGPGSCASPKGPGNSARRGVRCQPNEAAQDLASGRFGVRGAGEQGFRVEPLRRSRSERVPR